MVLLCAPGPVPFETCIWSTCWHQSSYQTCRIFTGLCTMSIPIYFLDFTGHTNRKFTKAKWQHKKVSCTSDSHLTEVVKLVNGIQIFNHWVILSTSKAFNFYSSRMRQMYLRLWPTPLVCALDHRRRPDERCLQRHILETIFWQNLTKTQKMAWGTFQMFFEACDFCNQTPFSLVKFANLPHDIKQFLSR